MWSIFQHRLVATNTSATSSSDSLQSSTTFCHALFYIHLIHLVKLQTQSNSSFSLPYNLKQLLPGGKNHAVPYIHSFIMKINQQPKIRYLCGYVHVLEMYKLHFLNCRSNFQQVVQLIQQLKHAFLLFQQNIEGQKTDTTLPYLQYTKALFLKTFFQLCVCIMGYTIK